MPPPTLYVMSTEATGPRSDRQPAGVAHAAPSTHPPVHRSFCGQSHGLFWFGHVDFWSVPDSMRCTACVDVISRLAVGDGGQPWTMHLPPAAGGGN